MKASEAKQKVCPFMSNVVILDGIDETIEKLSTANCICNDCMAWECTEEWEYRNGQKYKPVKDTGYCKRIGQ